MSEATSHRSEKLLEQLLAAADPQALLVEIELDGLAAEDPALGELARLAAIPRRLDRGVVAALRGAAAPEPGRDDVLLDRLLGLGLADSAAGGRPTYHDGAREILLDRLRTNPEWRPRFDAAGRRLVQYFLGRIDDAYAGLNDVRQVTPWLIRADADRLRGIANAAERALVAPAVEALYHAVLVDPEWGWSEFVRLFDWHEVRGLTRSCRAMRSAVEQNLRQLAPAALERRRRWFVYFDGRLLAQQGRPADAAAAYRLATTALADVPLQLAAFGALADVLEADFQWGEAQRAARDRLDIARAAGDEETHRNALLFLAFLEYRLGRPSVAVEMYEDLERDAEARGDLPLLVNFRSVHAALDLDLGRRQLAVDRLLGALDLARTDPRVGPAAGALVAQTLAEALKRDHPRFATAELAEQAALSPALSPEVRRSAAVGQAQLLLDAGLLRRAEDVLSGLRADPDGARSPDVLGVAAQLLEKQGDLEASRDTWRAVLDDGSPSANPRQTVVALANCADLSERLGQTETAVDYCRRAHDAADRLGHGPLRGIVTVVHARAALNVGRLDEARTLLDEARPDLQDAPFQAIEHRVVEARLTQRAGRYHEAVTQHREAVSAAWAMGMWDRVAQLGSEAAVTASDAADWGSTAELARRVTDIAAELAARAVAETDLAETEADRWYGDGMRALYDLGTTADTGAAEVLNLAADRLGEAVHRRPDHPLYRLGLAYVHVRGARWSDAVVEFDAAVAALPALLADSAITERALSCQLRASDALRAAGEQGRALMVLADAAERARGRPGRLAAVELLTADTSVEAGDREGAHAHYERAGASAEQAGDATVRGHALARRGALWAADEDPDRVRPLWHAALQAFDAGDGTSPYWALLRSCSALPASITRRPSFERLVRDLRDDPSSGEPMHAFRPQLRAAVPDSWMTKESVTLLAPDGSANVIMSSEPLDPSIDTDEYARVQGDLLHTEFPGYDEDEFVERPLLGGRRCLLRRFSWAPPDGRPVTQIQLYHADEGRGYTATATTTSERFVDLQLQLEQVMEGLFVAPAPPA